MIRFKDFVPHINMWDPNRIYRVDPVGRTNPWARSDYAVLKNPKNGQILGTSPLPQDHNVKPGDVLDGDDQSVVHKVVNRAFATPYTPNGFYGAFGRTAGPNGSPVEGVAVYDENKMWGEDRDPNYKGTLHITKDNLARIPKYVNVHSADRTPDWQTENFSGKEEITSPNDPVNPKKQKVRTRDLLNSQYNMVVHNNTSDMMNAAREQIKNNPNLSVLNQASEEL